MPHTAYSYIRFSTPEQARGDSLRRQTQSAADWCKRNAITLDTSRNLHDLGRSAYAGSHRTNPDRNALAAFLEMVKQGKIARGSYLLVESLDRLTREHIRPALTLLLNLIEAGVRVVQLKPTEIVYDSDVEPMTLMMALMELSRGNSESRIKGERVGKAWAQKKELARRGESQVGRGPVAGMACMTHKLPAWIEERGGTLHLVRTRAAVVKRIYHLAAAGYSATSIVKLFRRDGVPPMGRSGAWVRSYISHILSDRRPVGEYQPKNRAQQPDGEPIPGYFPSCITDAEWHAARGMLAGRQFPPTRTTDYVCLFSGLLRDARDGTSYYRQVAGAAHPHDLLVNRCQDSDLPKRSFPLAVFEKAVLSLLAEVDPRDVIGGIAEPDETSSLAGEIAHVEAKIAELEAELLQGNVAAVAKVLRQQEARLKELHAKLAEARQKAAHPLKDSWADTKTLVSVLEDAEDVTDTRLRIRAALRRIVESIWLLIVPRGIIRLAAVQVNFIGGARRDYLIVHRPAKANKTKRTEGGWQARSITWPAQGSKKRLGRAKDLDLREREDASALEAALQTIDLGMIFPEGEGGI
jgi:DNA invertase Pin-like site-specific DNA recombinase